MGKLQVIVDGQYGSTGKGAVAAHLARPATHTRWPLSAVRVAGPNAGHSAVDPSGRKWPLRCIPVAAVVDPQAHLYLAAGSEIDYAVLLKEVRQLEEAGIPIRDRLVIDPMATVLEHRHHDIENTAGLVERIGSTGKGIGAARADRILREAKVVRDTDLHDGFAVDDVAPLLHRDLADDATVQIEGTQGYGLGLHHEFYPQVTSSDCRAIDFLAMAGVSPWAPEVTELEIWVVYRPYPIRVAGNSGPMLDETTWEQLGLQPEKTTVTQKVRRVGHWDGQLAQQALAANGGPSDSVHVALTMADQLDPAVAGVTDRDELLRSKLVVDFLDRVHQDLSQCATLVGTSDRTMVRL